MNLHKKCKAILYKCTETLVFIVSFCLFRHNLILFYRDMYIEGKGKFCMAKVRKERYKSTSGSSYSKGALRVFFRAPIQ